MIFFLSVGRKKRSTSFGDESEAREEKSFVNMSQILGLLLKMEHELKSNWAEDYQNVKEECKNFKLCKGLHVNGERSDDEKARWRSIAETVR